LEHLISELLENARTFEDSLLAKLTLIYSLRSRNKQLEFMEMGLTTPNQLGEMFPSMNPGLWRVCWERRRLRSMLMGLSDEDIFLH
jgi:hypothetical protein